ncbi:MAG: alpha-glucan family phosphorylase [Spirochaetes bacterium]|nr:alpha-glucan family phosphorylase [Spirochaetota bacterium]
MGILSENLVYNLWFSWSKRLDRYFVSIDKDFWEACHHNPVLFIKKKRDNAAINKLAREFENEYREYMDSTDLWGNKISFPIAYFSAEYGLHESLPVYSGGLGILSGDHLKSASDLGIPLIGVGLFYKRGYFVQSLDKEGNQIALYPVSRMDDLPVRPVLDRKGNRLIISLPMGGTNVYTQAWLVNVGRVKLYFLDTDIKENKEGDRGITSQLYQGAKGNEIRIRQEILLGMGGVKLLRALNIDPKVWHINEGHSAFLILELAKEEMENNTLSFDQALCRVRKRILFTTHTPVKEGHENFPRLLMEKYFKGYLKTDGLLKTGNFAHEKNPENFSMTILALKYSARANAVSRINAQVSKQMWAELWPEKTEQEIPIDAITNGVHHSTWVADLWDDLFVRYIDAHWRDRVDQRSLWDRVRDIPSEEIWDRHVRLKQRLTDYVRQAIQAQHARNKSEPEIIEQVMKELDKEALIIGFARRFAVYKRATLILSDESALKQILLNETHPVRLIFAGKAHPADLKGQEFLKMIYHYSLKPLFRGKILFLENYDISVARYLTQGADVWLNNPRKPYEASGTSGQKAGMNGVLNFSQLDGWWPEAYNGKNGWAIPGDEDEAIENDMRDKREAESIYKILNTRIIPCFYNRNSSGIPVQWIDMMKESILTVMPVYNTHRMVKEYCEKYYFPLMK